MKIPRGLLCVFLVLMLLVTVVVILVVALKEETPSCDHGFLHGAVAADSEICSDIGRDILKQGGSPVDSAIAALICTTVTHPQSMGLGGGVIFTIYNASTGEVEVINAREAVPYNSSPDLTDDCSNHDFIKPGVKWIGVPGELKGYETAHKRHGRLPWKSLFEPTIKLVTDGIQVSSVLNKYLSYLEKTIKMYSLCQLFCKDNKVLEEGQSIDYSQLGHTLRVLADEGADSFYNGSLTEKILNDLRKEGSVLTEDDFRNYQVKIVKPLKLSLGSYIMYTPPPPAGGALISFILNILEGYALSPKLVKNEKEQIETYHRIAEAFKFANGQKARLAEALAARNTNMITETLLSQAFAQNIRDKIDDSGDHPLSFYNVSETHPETFGTTHISVITQDGSSVSVTSSINHVFGAMIYSPSTGIILNNELADFCISRSSKPKAGDSPPSSMTPAIIFSKDKKFQLVIGGAGGERIISATTLAIINKLWLGHSLEEAISLPVFYVTASNKLEFEPSFNKVVQQGLQKKGHQFHSYTFALNVVQAVSQENGCLFAFSDKRKFAKAAGY
ncbi:glutathione hydrolase 5 proenzyme [Gastrophryne carolinensis]